MSEVQSLSRMSKIETINPATGKILATYENVNADEVSRKVKAAREASVNWMLQSAPNICVGLAG